MDFVVRAKVIGPSLLALLVSVQLTACGGGGGSSASDDSPDLDALSTETSQLWDSGNRRTAFHVTYGGLPDAESVFSDNQLQQQGLGQLMTSRIVYLESEGRLLADEVGTQFLDIDVTALPTTVTLGQARHSISSACELDVQQHADIDGEADLAWFSWTHVETARLTDVPGTAGCDTTLAAVAGDLNSAASAAFPFDLVTLLQLGAIDGNEVADLESWEIRHEQRVSKYYRAIGDEAFELAGARQRLTFDVFENATNRAQRLVDQLTP